MAKSTRERALIAISTAMLAGGLMTALAPPSSDQDQRSLQEQRQQRDLEHLAEHEERRREEQRRAGQAHGEAEHARSLTPAEVRRPPRPRIRLIP